MCHLLEYSSLQESSYSSSRPSTIRSFIMSEKSVYFKLLHCNYVFGQVRTWKMHAFTIVQCLAVGTLWGVKLSPASIAYPMSIVLLIPLRNILSTYFFTNREIEAVSNGHCKHVVIVPYSLTTRKIALILLKISWLTHSL